MKKPKKAAISSGSAIGRSKINAYDKALIDAGIGDLNLVEISSILPPGCKIVELPIIEPGTIVECVISSASFRKIEVGDENCVSSAIVIAMSKNGLNAICESSGIKSEERTLNDAKNKANEMLKYRGLDLKNIISESSSVKSSSIETNEQDIYISVVSAVIVW